jgi:hypothetical protein
MRIELSNPLNLVHPSTMLRACPEFIEGANGNRMESANDLPFMLTPVEASLNFA